jgi:hypothetical protein
MQLHDGLHLQLGDRSLPIPESVARRLTTTDVHGRTVIVGIRPEHLSPTIDQDPNGIPVQVELTEAMGAEVYAYFTAAVSSPDLTALADTQASMSSFVARLPAGTETRGGEPMQLRPDLHEVHLFDPASLTTLLAPADEAEVRARQAGSTIQIAGGTSRTAAQAPADRIDAAPALQPALGVEPTLVGTLGAFDSTRIESVFEQAVAPPLVVEPLVAEAPAEPAGARSIPAFADQMLDGTALASDPAPARRGFTPRVIGAAPVEMVEQIATVELHDDEIDDALDHIEQVESATEIPFAALRRDVEATAPSSSFRTALARVREQHDLRTPPADGGMLSNALRRISEAPQKPNEI